MARWFITGILLCEFLLRQVEAADPAPARAADLIRQGRWKEAKSLIDPLLKEASPSADTFYLASRISLSFRKLDDAVQLVEKAMALDPKNAEYHFMLSKLVGEQASKASLLSQIGLGRRFKKELDRSLELDPKLIEAREILMTYYAQAPSIMGGDMKKAAEVANGIIQDNPARGWVAKGDLLQISHKTKEAEECYLRAWQKAPNDFRVLTNLGGFYLSRSQWPNAEKFGRLAMQSLPSHARGYEIAAVALVEQGKIDALRTLLREAEQKTPQNRAPHFFAAAELLKKDSELELARECLEKYVSLAPEGYGPDPAEARLLLGKVLTRRGKNSEAAAEFRAALKIDPNLDEARRLLKKSEKNL